VCPSLNPQNELSILLEQKCQTENRVRSLGLSVAVTLVYRSAAVVT